MSISPWCWARYGLLGDGVNLTGSQNFPSQELGPQQPYPENIKYGISSDIQWIQNQDMRTSWLKEKWIRYQLGTGKTLTLILNFVGHHWTISAWPVSWSWSFEAKGSPLEEPKHALWDTAVGESHSQIQKPDRQISRSVNFSTQKVIWQIIWQIIWWGLLKLLSRLPKILFWHLHLSLHLQVQRLFEAQRHFIQLPLELESSSWLEPLESHELGDVLSPETSEVGRCF